MRTQPIRLGSFYPMSWTGLGNLHRFGRYVRGRCRPIVARFLYQEDLDLVLDRAKWLHGSIFSIQRQYPTAMEERRKELIPIMRQLRMEGAVTKLVRDKLFVNGVLYDRLVEDNYTELTEREEKNYANAVQCSQTSVFPENTGE